MIEDQIHAVKIREICLPQDYPALIELWQTSGPGVHLGPSDTLPELEKKYLHDPELFLVAENLGEIIGSVVGGFDGRRGLVYHLAVASEQRGNGYGTMLMEELEKRLKAKGCLRCYLLVTPDNVGVEDFYTRQGWQPMELTIMAKNL